MKIVDGEGLWKALVAEGLTEKRVGEMSLQEVELMAAVFADHVDGDVAPFWNGKDLSFCARPESRRTSTRCTWTSATSAWLKER